MQFARSEEPLLRGISRQVKAGGWLLPYLRGLERPGAEDPAKLDDGEGATQVGTPGATEEDFVRGCRSLSYTCIVRPGFVWVS